MYATISHYAQQVDLLCSKLYQHNNAHTGYTQLEVKGQWKVLSSLHHNTYLYENVLKYHSYRN